MTYQDAALALAGGVARSVLLALRAIISPVEFIRVAGTLTARGNARAASLADVATSQELQVPPLGVVRPTTDVDRLEEAFSTVLERDEDPAPAVDRLARSEPLAAGRAARSEVMTQAGVTGWRRRLNEGACQLCVWLARDGKVFPMEKTMRVHPNCGCVMVPARAEEREVVNS